MAESPAHRFGQTIGSLLESVLRPQLEAFCRTHGLYLDHQQKERAARSGRKVSWKDQYGNTHDLDFVLERGGTDSTTGQPVAFIEVAWRRYTKHSRNKAQEIQGAILPLAERYGWSSPFLGTVLAGEFTEGSLAQLRSLGFHVLHFPYETLVSAFESEGIDIRFDESTDDDVFQRCVARIERTPAATMDRIRRHLVSANQGHIDSFFDALRSRLGRSVTRVLIIPLYGRVNEFSRIVDALRFMDEFRVSDGSMEFRKYEVQVEFSNGDRIQASFDSDGRVKEFLEFVSRQ
jgi:hypothetical protein